MAISRVTVTTWLSMSRAPARASAAGEPTPLLLYAHRCSTSSSSAAHCSATAAARAQRTGCRGPVLIAARRHRRTKHPRNAVRQARATALTEGIHRSSTPSSEPSGWRMRTSKSTSAPPRPPDAQLDAAKYQMCGRMLWETKPLTHGPHSPGSLPRSTFRNVLFAGPSAARWQAGSVRARSQSTSRKTSRSTSGAAAASRRAAARAAPPGRSRKRTSYVARSPIA
mmetsp:Transcript_11127/g.30283  ORF Transcript_11127/g.30283 Transcript_11127/m.30283 type:complete len:225 (+) Transcript_11127:894-1568(+)